MQDFFQIRSLLSDEESVIQNTAGEFVKSEFLPHIQQHFREGTFPTEIIPKLGELGFLGPTLPIEFGGSGISNVAYGLLMQELEYGDSGLRSFASVQGGLVMYPIYRYGSDLQKSRWLPQLAKGEAIGCFGLTEPNHGSDPEGMKTTAKWDGSNWILNGTKMWITNGSFADVAVVWAKDENHVVQGFLVEKDTPGFTAPIMHGKMSLRASVTSELVLENVCIPEDNRLPNTQGLSAPLSCLTQARYSIAWGVLGAAIDCYLTSLEYSKDRQQFGKPIASYQLTQKKFADMLTEITKAQLMVIQLGRLKDEGKMTFQQVSMAKRNNVEMAMTIARTARSILGANGITDDYPIMRHMANLESVFTYEGTHEMHTLILGEAITGIKAFD